MLIKLMYTICIMSVATTAVAQDMPILLFPKGAPGDNIKLTEKADADGGKTGGSTVLRITNVSEPTITIYPASTKNANGTAMVVCPGGGYSILAYDLEGSEVCAWLNNIGITAILLKYRVPSRDGMQKHIAAIQDLQRAISYVRAHAQEIDIDPQRIGVMGFSAGGHLSAMACNHYDQRTYQPTDDADTVSSRPDFCLLVYPAYLDGEKNFQLAPELKVSPNTPPTMLIQTEDDKSYINSSLFYYYALKEAGVPAQMHLYSKGGHGYGLRKTGEAVNEWPRRAEEWFRDIGVL